MATSEDTIGAAMRDYALDQLAHIDMQLARAGAWQHTGVHLARKGLARLRACLELLRKSPLTAQALERHARTLAHGLSSLRDTQAALSTAKALRRDGDPETREVWQERSRELRHQRERALGAALITDPGFAARRREIADLRPAVGAIAWSRLLAADLRAGLARTDKRARKARGKAREATAAEPRHKLRRRSRHVLLQIELLRAIVRDSTRPRASAEARFVLKQVFGKATHHKRRKHLIDELGWEQDLRVLRRALPPRPPSTAERLAVKLLRDQLLKAQATSNKHIDC